MVVQDSTLNEGHDPTSNVRVDKTPYDQTDGRMGDGLTQSVR